MSDEHPPLEKSLTEEEIKISCFLRFLQVNSWQRKIFCALKKLFYQKRILLWKIPQQQALRERLDISIVRRSQFSCEHLTVGGTCLMPCKFNTIKSLYRNYFIFANLSQDLEISVPFFDRARAVLHAKNYGWPMPISFSRRRTSGKFT